MGIFDDFKNTIGGTVNDLSAQGKEFSNKKRLEKEIRSFEENIEQKFHELGKVIYEKHKDDAPEELKEVISDITISYNKIDDIRKELASMSGKLVCPECGMENIKDAKFCSSCGHKMEVIVEKPSNKSFCSECGTELKEGAIFCSSCGSKVEVAPKPEEEVKETVTVESEDVE